MAFEQSRRHRRDIKGRQDPTGTAGGLAVRGDRAEEIAGVEAVVVSTATLGSDREGVHRVAERLGEYGAGRVEPVGDLTGELHRPGTAIAPVFSGRCSWTGHAVVDPPVAVEVTLEVDGALVEEGAHHVVGITQPGDRSRAFPSMPYCSSIAILPIPKTTSARPPLSWSRVAAELGDAGRVPQQIGETQGPSRLLRALGDGGEKEPGVPVVHFVSAVGGVITETVGRRAPPRPAVPRRSRPSGS